MLGPVSNHPLQSTAVDTAPLATDSLEDYAPTPTRPSSGYKLEALRGLGRTASAVVRGAYKLGTTATIAPGLDKVHNIKPFLATAAKEVYSAGLSRLAAEAVEQFVEYHVRRDPRIRTGVLAAVTLLGVARAAALGTLLVRRRRTTSQQEVNEAYLGRQEAGNCGSNLFHVSNAVTTAELIGIPLAALSLDIMMQRGHRFPGVDAVVEPAQWSGLLLRDEVYSLLRDYLIPTLKTVAVSKPAAAQGHDASASRLTLAETAIQGARFGLSEQFVANIAFDYATNAAGPGPADAPGNFKRALARSMINAIPEWWDAFAVDETLVSHLRSQTPAPKQIASFQALNLKAGLGERLLDHSSSRVGNYHLDRLAGFLSAHLPVPGPELIKNDTARTFAAEFIQNIFVAIAIGAAYPLQTGQLQVFAHQRANSALPVLPDQPVLQQPITGDIALEAGLLGASRNPTPPTSRPASVAHGNRVSKKLVTTPAPATRRLSDSAEIAAHDAAIPARHVFVQAAKDPVEAKSADLPDEQSSAHSPLVSGRIKSSGEASSIEPSHQVSAVVPMTPPQVASPAVEPLTAESHVAATATKGIVSADQPTSMATPDVRRGEAAVASPQPRAVPCVFHAKRTAIPRQSES
jgi:hypothetical protein